MKTWEQKAYEAGEIGGDGLPTLLQARIMANKTQKELAEVAGVSHQSYRAMEKGMYGCKDLYYERLKAVIGDFKRKMPQR